MAEGRKSMKSFSVNEGLSATSREGVGHPLLPRKGCRLAYRKSALASSMPKAAG